MVALLFLKSGDRNQRNMGKVWLCDFIKNNNDMFNLLIGVLGLVVSFLGVYYGKKAYIAANKIFQKGIQIGRKEILEQISLEFTTEFFIPFSLFKGGTKNLWIGPGSV